MDWKITAVAAVAIVIFISAILAAGVIPVDLETGGISGFFAALTGAQEGNISINIIFDFQEIELDTKASFMEVKIINPSSEITLGRNKVDLSGEESVKLEISDWDGKINAGNKLMLDGTAGEVKINGIKIAPIDKNSKLFLEGLEYKDLKVRDVFLPKFSFDSARGFVYINNGKTTVRVENEPVEIGSFAGDITLDTSLRMDGATNKLFISGENKLSIQES